jgi:hypothetical protein
LSRFRLHRSSPRSTQEQRWRHLPRRNRLSTVGVERLRQEFDPYCGTRIVEQTN